MGASATIRHSRRILTTVDRRPSTVDLRSPTADRRPAIGASTNDQYFLDTSRDASLTLAYGPVKGAIRIASSVPKGEAE